MFLVARWATTSDLYCRLSPLCGLSFPPSSSRSLAAISVSMIVVSVSGEVRSMVAMSSIDRSSPSFLEAMYKSPTHNRCCRSDSRKNFGSLIASLWKRNHRFILRREVYVHVGQGPVSSVDAPGSFLVGWVKPPSAKLQGTGADHPEVSGSASLICALSS
jgi:hypothetical protein